MDETTSLRIGSYGNRPVSEVLATLRAVKHAHDGLLILAEVLADEPALRSHYRMERSLRGFPGREIEGRYLQRYISPKNELIVRSVALSSPGFWEFVGALNPLTFIRDLLQDRHVRRQDREYREYAERRSLYLDNELKANRVIQERLAIARELGMTPQQQTMLFNELAIGPLMELEQVQDRGMLFPVDQGSGEIDPPPNESERDSDPGG